MMQRTMRISLDRDVPAGDRAVLAKYQIDVFPGEFGDEVLLPEGTLEMPPIVVKCFVGGALKEVQTERRYLAREGLLLKHCLWEEYTIQGCVKEAHPYLVLKANGTRCYRI